MIDSRDLLSGKAKYFFGSVILVFLSAICAAFTMTDNDDFAIARREILLRRIGHEFLLQSGDSTSRVLPVKKIAGSEYQVSFEKQFTFLPDSLVNITKRILNQDPLAGDYVVNVLKRGEAGVAYGYAISKNKKDNIISCRGRKQPKAYYTIDIKFEPTGMITAKNGYLLGGLPLLAFVGFIFLRSGKPRSTLSGPDQATETVRLGSALFDANKRKLIVNGVATDLTGTETRLLKIFAASPNEIIERSRLQKEIWEDEGVIVGRSLDMFISKLRKKLKNNPEVNIVVVRGKGYRLEVNS